MAPEFLGRMDVGDRLALFPGHLARLCEDGIVQLGADKDLLGLSGPDGRRCAVSENDTRVLASASAVQRDGDRYRADTLVRLKEVEFLILRAEFRRGVAERLLQR